MPDGLYKVRARYAYDPAQPARSTMAALELADRAGRWLRDNQCSEHFVNVYDNEDGRLVFVLSSRNTAVMLKLALA